MNKRPTKNTSPPRRTSPPPRRPLTQKEIEQRRARAEAARRAAAREAALREKIKQENKKRRAAMAKLFFYRFLVYLLLLALILSVFSVIFFINLNKVDKSDKSDFIYYLADNKKSRIPYDTVKRNGAVYVNLSEIAEKFDISITGSYDELRFLPDKNDEYVRFYPDSRTAYVNGNPIILSVPAVLEDECLWIPIDFITRYVDGISLKYNEKERTITVKRLSYGAIDKAITFTLKNSPSITAIPEEDGIGSIPEAN